MVDFSELVGKTFNSVVVADNNSRVEFYTRDGDIYALFHDQDCCEHVYVESVIGDLSDLVGVPILVAEEATSNETPAGYVHDYKPVSQTWTFYKLRTIKGSVDIRWFGESNGYYSESVTFDEL